jgi:RNA polymerase sigma-70 factor (ECF subfamily)
VTSGDESLMGCIAGGDREALAMLYDRFAPIMLGLAKRMLGSPREAEDLVHDVFLEAWHRARYYDASRGSVRAWLMLRLRSRALDRKRVLRRRGASVALDEEKSPLVSASDHAAGSGVDAARLHTVLQTLPLEQRAIVELSYFEGRTHVEIAAELAVPVGTVKSRMARAISLLRVGMRGKAVSQP